MQYRRFGRTELRMPVFSCGGMRYQYKWEDVPLSEVPEGNQRNLEATVRRAIELGIHHIETARGYGSSERQLGLVLPQFPREQLIVQTKIAPEADPGVFRRHFEESLDRMRLEHVDLLALHGVNTAEHLWHSVKKNGCLAMARRLQREGLVRHVGLSTHAALPLILDAVRHEEDGGFDYINLHWYYINQRNQPAIDEAARRDMGVFIISPADKGGMLYRPPARLVELCRPLHPLVFNGLFCLQNRQVHTLSLGAACPGDFDLQLQTLDWTDRAGELLPPILARLREAMVNAVGAQAADRIDEGLPEWDEAPGYMNLKVMLWLRHLALAFDLVEYGRMRYNLLGNGGHWFPGLNASALDHLDLTEALKDSPFAGEIPAWLREARELFAGSPKKRLSRGT